MTAHSTPATVRADTERGADPLIRIEGMTTGYAGVPVVRDVSLSVAPREVVALLGPNGAGKTTTLLALSGLLRLLGGSVDVLGQAPSTSAPHRVARRGLAHVPEDRSLFFQLSTMENLRLGVRGSRSSQSSALSGALDLFPALRPLLGRRAGLLSGGEQQMLILARALASQPKVLVIDEMSLGLAPIVVERLLATVREIVAQTGIGILLVEQHVQLALEVSDHAYVMSHGEIVLQGTARELLHRADLVEASYLGEGAMG